jgi:fucose permease
MLEFFIMLGMLIVLTAVASYRRSIVLGLTLVVIGIGLIFKVDTFEWDYKGWIESALALWSSFGIFIVINSARNLDTEG